MLHRLSIVLSSVLLFGAVHAQEDSKGPKRIAPVSSAPAGVVHEWTSPEGQPFWYRIPEKIDPKNPPSLLIMLHGTGCRHFWSFANYPIASGKWRPQDIVVSPEGMTPGQGDTFNFVQNQKDGDQIVSLIRMFRKQFDIGRVYLYGHSQGAFFCYWFAGEHPELVDGIVAHAGNVLSVKHPKEAKNNVAIGILHADSDQVVPVECAHRTEKIYREQGYRLLKMQIVEGIREQAGHWPLPKHVGEMLEWLDQVTAQSAMQAIRTAAVELERELPDIAAVAAAIERANQLGKKDRVAVQDPEFVAALQLAEAFLDECARSHAQAFADVDGMKASKIQYAAWVPHFRAVHPGLAGREAWTAAVGATARKVKSHDTQVQRALQGLAKTGVRSFAKAFKAFDLSVLSADYPALRTSLEDLMALKQKGLRPKAKAKLQAVLDTRRPMEAEGDAQAIEITKAATKRFKAAHAEHFAK